jgi:adenylate/nucleoside-diphosphate kinase
MFYNFSTEKACQKFITNPDRYVGLILPSSLPKKVSQSEVKSTFPLQFELKGYCPVTFQEGPSGYYILWLVIIARFSSIVDGVLEFCAEYEGKLYSTKNEAQLEKFMKYVFGKANSNPLDSLGSTIISFYQLSFHQKY